MSANPPPFDLARARLAYWGFHWGRPPDREFAVVGPRRVHRVPLWQLGTLVGLELRGVDDVWVRRGTVHLASDRFGRDLYLVARGRIGALPPRGLLSARIGAVRYRTNKDGGNDVWRHAFEGTRPVLALDAGGWPVIRRAGSAYAITWRGIVG